MSYSEKTFRLLKKSVLDSMKFHAAEPIKLPKPRLDTRQLLNLIVAELRLIPRLSGELSYPTNKEQLANQISSAFGRPELNIYINYISIHQESGMISYSLTGLKYIKMHSDEPTSNIPHRTVFREQVSYAKFLDDIFILLQEDKSTLAKPGLQIAIKNITNQTKGKSAYVYLTDAMFSAHYRVLGQVENVDSCMSKSNSYYNAERKTIIRTTRNANYIHPVEAYEKNPHFRLMLLTDTHHDNWGDNYPFKLRAITRMEENTNRVIGYPNMYGNEQFANILKQNFNYADMEGARLRVLTTRYGDQIAPYVDGDSQHVNPDGLISEGSSNVEHSTGRVEETRYVDTRGEYYNEEDLRWCDPRDEYIHENDAVEDVYGIYHYDGDENETYFASEISGDILPIEEKVELYPDRKLAGSKEISESNDVVYLEYNCEYAETSECFALHDGSDWIHGNDIGDIARYCAFNSGLYLMDEMTFVEETQRYVADENLDDYIIEHGLNSEDNDENNEENENAAA